MKNMNIKLMHILYFIISLLIFFIYIYNPVFLYSDMKHLLNIILVVILILQLGQLMYIKRKDNSKRHIIMGILDILIPVVGLIMGVGSITA